MAMMHFTTTSVEDTRAFGRALAAELEPGVVLVLVGGLGAGKTALVQGIAQGLGVEDRVTSPTFTMVSSYRTVTSRGIETLLHADLYRVSSGAEADDLAIGELVEDRAVACVEWGDIAPEVLGDRRVSIALSRGDADDDRLINLEPGPLGAATVAEALAGWSS